MGIFLLFSLAITVFPPIVFHYCVPRGLRWSYALMITGVLVALLGYWFIPGPEDSGDSTDSAILSALFFMGLGGMEFACGCLMRLASLYFERTQPSPRTRDRDGGKIPDGTSPDNGSEEASE